MRVVILGGGISGLLAAYALKDRGHEITIVDSAKSLGGTFADGGLKYVRSTPRILDMFANLGISPETYKPRGAIWSGGEAKLHPQWLMSLPLRQRLEIQGIHWMKTRGTLEGMRTDCMNDPGNSSEHGDAVRFNNLELLIALAKVAGMHCKTLLQREILCLDSGYVVTVGGNLAYDRLVSTVPLPVFKRMIPEELARRVPDVRCNKLSVIHVKGVTAPMDWDYLYTPYSASVSRISKVGDGAAQMECPHPGDGFKLMPSSAPDWIPLLSKHSVLVVERVTTMNGHLIPMRKGESLECLPKKWLMLGRFAEWNPRSTSEKSLDRVSQWRDDNGL